MTERWEAVAEAPSYEVSTLGRVRRGSRYLKPWRNGKEGYVRVTLRTEDGTSLKRYVHRLVAIAFLPNPDNLPEVNHDDGDPSNCTKDNLEWVTTARNRIHSRDVLGAQHGAAPVPITAVCLTTGKVSSFPSIRSASADLGVPAANIYKVLIGERQHAGSYSFIKEKNSCSSR